MSLRNLINALIRNRKTLIALSAVVVFVTTYLLILPAATLEKGAAEEMGGIDVDQKAVEETTDASADDSGDGSIDDADAEPSAEAPDAAEKDVDSESESDGPKLTFKGKGFTVDVADPQGVLPEDTELSVSEITTDDKKYDKYCSDALAALVDNTGAGSDAEPGFVRLYDIKLIAGDQVIEPEDNVKVTIAYDNKHKSNSGENALKIENEESVYVVHFKEDETTGEEQAEVLDKEATSFQIRKEQLQEATFEADSFSVYAIVDLPETTASTLDIIGEKGSDGFQISIKTGNGAPSDSNNYYMTGELIHGVSGNSDRDGITATQYSNTIPEEAIKYYFERIDDSDQFYIYKMVGSERKYIQMTPVGANAGRAGLTFAESESDRTAFSLINETQGRFQVSASITTTSGAQKTYYWVRNTKGFGTGTIVGFENKSDANTAWIGLHQEGAFTDPYGLDGKSYSLLIWDGGKTGKALTSNKNDDYQGNLCADFLTVMTKSGDADDKLYVPGDTSGTVTSWNFEWIGEDRYKLSAEVGVATKYLKINSDGLSMVESPDAASEIQVIPGTGIHKKQIILKSGNYTLTYSGVYEKGFDTNAGAGKEYLYLAEARNESLLKDYYRTYSATKISVSDQGLSPESPDAEPKKIIIYTRVWNGSGYTYFAVNGKGELVPCYERGDSIEWIGSTLDELQWEFIEHGSWEGDTFSPNYYYDLRNPFEGTYLAPQREGKDGEPQILSYDAIGLNMSGRRNGQYYTPIIAWDTDNYSYTSINVDLEAGAGARIEACLSRYGLDFYFATVDELPVDDTLHTVSTVDNDQFGITMKLVNFGTRKQMSDFLGDDTGGMTTKLVKGLLSTNLIGEGEEKYPTAKGGSLGTLFNNNPQVVNHLFTDSTFRATGYYEYDSAQNFAHLITEDNDPWIGQPSPNGGTYKKGDFVVYQELGSYDKDDKKTLKHGQFFPFNDLEPGVFASTNGRNLYTPTGKELDESDPRFNEQLYMIKNTDCYFGTELTATFEQTPSGLDAWGHDIIFEFSGDDDFWLYVDDELTIDLGGIHSAVPGTVNFRTGDVYVNGEQTTLLDLFIKNKVGRGEYANVQAARAALLDNDQTGIFVTKTDPDDPLKVYYVFKDNTPHTMRIFYMERGAGASNLHMRFNLAAVKKGTVQLTKKLSNVDDAGANATAYPYQIFYKNPENTETDEWIQLTEADMGTTSGGSVKYKGSVNDVEYRTNYHIDHEEDGVTYRAKYNHVFLLPAGETAEITFPTFGNTGKEKYVTDYYIVECGVDPEIYQYVSVDDESIAGTAKKTEFKVVDGHEVELPAPADSGLRDYRIDYSTLTDRPRVTYDNKVKETKSINIIKELYKNENGHREKIVLYNANGDPIVPGNPDLDRVFEFRLKLRAPNSDTEWKDCNRIIYYHVKDPKGHYCIWDKDEGKLVATDKSKLEDLTEEQKILGTFESSESGAMSNIPAYYTVEVNGMIPGTEYQVVERPNETPAGYKFWKYRAGNKETAEGYDPLNGIEGSITTDEAGNKVFICNDKGYELLLKKVWADAATIENRDPSYFAVFYEVKDPVTGAVTKPKLIDDSVKQLKYDAKPQKLDWWYLNLPEIDGVDKPAFGRFVVYEVKGTFDVNDEGIVTNSQDVEPVLEGGALSLNGTPLGGSETEIAYKVTYDDPKTTGDNVREFKATNTPSKDPSVKFLKEDWSENALEDAEFTLKRGSYTVFNKKSNAQGLISTEFLSKDTDYVLEETKAPQGYYGLQESLTVQLIKDASDEWTLRVTPATEDIAKYYEVGDYDQDNNCVTLTIKDRPYEFEAVKVDSTDPSTRIEGAVFNLYEQAAVGTQLDWRIKQWDDGQEGLTTDLTTGTDGLIPHVDSSLPAGKYQLREKTAAGGYKKIDGNIEFTVSRQGSITLGDHPANVELSGPNEGTGDEGKLVYTLTIPNDPMPSFKLKKVDRSTDDPLKGAVFQLTKKKGGATGGDGHPIWEALPDGNYDIDMTDTAEFELPLLPSGYYRLEEKDAPEGYIILEDFIYFHITDDGTVELCDEDGNVFPESEYPAYESLTGDKTAGFVIIAKDSPGSELPHTGGIGTTIFYILGTMLVLGCGVYLIARRRISQ